MNSLVFVTILGLAVTISEVSPAPQYASGPLIPTVIPPVSSCISSWRDFPVCGTNGATYGSTCLLQADQIKFQGLRVDHVGECITNNGVRLGLGVASDLNRCGLCPPGQPVCGSNGITYGSMCDLQCQTLLDGRAIEPVSAGPCGAQLQQQQQQQLYMI